MMIEIEDHKIYKGSLDEYLEKKGISCSNPLDESVEKMGISISNDMPTYKDDMLSLDRNLMECGDNVSNNDPTKRKYITDLNDQDFARYSLANEDLVLDIDDPEIKINYLLKNTKGVGILPTENIGLVVSPPKSGKSTFVSILIASILGCGKHFGFYAHKKDAKVLHIDTEQGKAHQQRNMKYIYCMCQKYRMSKDEFRKRFRTIHARAIRSVELRQRTETEIIIYNPDFVVIDGVAQMIDDIMDQEESAKLNDQLQDLSERYKCSIMCVIHTPKQKNNETDWNLFIPKGALGTMLMQGVADRFVCVKKEADKSVNEQTFIVHHESRDETIGQFTFKRDPQNNGMPIPYYEVSTDNSAEKVCMAIKEIYANNGNKAIAICDLRKQIADKLKSGFGKSTLENRWGEFIEPIKDELFIMDNGKRKLIKMKDPNDPEQTEFNPIADPDHPTDEAPY